MSDCLPRPEGRLAVPGAAGAAAAGHVQVVVHGFLRATVDADDNYSAARAFLAPGATWNTTAGTTLYNQAGLLLTRVGSTGVNAGPCRRDDLEPRRLHRRPGEPGPPVHHGPAGRAVADLATAARCPARHCRCPALARLLESVYYLNSSGTGLVPDQILVAPEQPGTATTLMRALLSGPPAPLLSAVTTALPAGTRLLGNVPVGSNGVAQVDLSVLLHPISSQTLRSLSAQIVWTLTQLPQRDRGAASRRR